MDVAAILQFVSKRARPYLQATVKSAAHHDAFHELPKLTALVGGERRILDRPPTVPTSPGSMLGAAEGLRSPPQEDRASSSTATRWYVA